MVGGALAFGAISLQLSGSRAVLAAARDIAPGHVFEASDLRVVNIGSAEGVTPIASSDQDSVIGHPARVAIVSGALLTPGDVGAPSVAAGNEAVVAVSLKGGRYPPAVAAGAHVEVIDTGGSDPATGSPASQTLFDATVIAVDPDPSPAGGGGAVISLRVSTIDAARLAAAAAAGRLILILVPPNR